MESVPGWDRSLTMEATTPQSTPDTWQKSSHHWSANGSLQTTTLQAPGKAWPSKNPSTITQRHAMMLQSIHCRSLAI